MNASIDTLPSLNILSPSDLKELLIDFIGKELAQRLKDKYLFVTVRGELGNLSVPPYAKDYPSGVDFTYYNTPLKDNSATVEVEHTQSLCVKEGLKEGSYVEVHGCIKIAIYKGNVTLRIKATSMKCIESPAEIAERERKADVLRFLKSVQRDTVTFPAAPLHISVIQPRSTEAGIDEDFRKGLGPYANFLDEPLPVAITSAQQIVAAINKAQGNVLVLIRGGGDASDFDVFSTRPVLEALANKKVYRITGIGHSRTATVADWMVEHSAVTPTDAGNFIREQLEQVAKRDKEAQCNQQQLTEQLCKVRAQDTEIGGLKQALEHKTELLDRAKATADELRQQHRTLKANLIIFGAVAVLGLVILLWWLR